MGRPVRQIKGYSSSEIRSLFNKEDKYKTGLRLYAVYQVSLGQSSRKLEELYNTSHNQILNWVSRFEKEGIEGLKDKEGRGRKSRLTPDQRESLSLLLTTKTPLDYGYNGSTWTGPLLTDWIKNKWGISYKKTQIYNIIKSLGFSYQKSKGYYPEADKERQEQFKEALKKTT